MKTIKWITIGWALATLVACGNKNSEFDASGTFEATEIIVSSEANGRLEQFAITEGQQLQAGSPIGYIDTIQLYLKKRQLQASGKAVASRHADISKQIAATRQEITTQQQEKTRYANLLKENAANQKQLDDIEARITLLEKQLAAQLSTLENSNRGVSEEGSALDIQVAQLNDQLKKCHISSPVTGTVLNKYMEQGELATIGKALFKVADVNTLFLRSYITSSQLSAIKVGQTVAVFSDYGDNIRKEYPGTISWISDKAEFTPKGILTKDERANLVYAVKIKVENDGYLKIGMYGEMKIDPVKK